MKDAAQRIADVVSGWSIHQPLMFAVWNLHAVVAADSVPTIRSGQRRIEYNPSFIASIDDAVLGDVLAIEAMRIALGHPYDRQQSNRKIAYAASNVTLQEYLRTKLPIPRAIELFDDAAFAGMHFEFYYQALISMTGDEPANDPSETSDRQPTASDDAPIQSHTEAAIAGLPNTQLWDDDALTRQQIDAAIRRVDADGTWGSIGSSGRAVLKARLRPAMDYRGILKRFRRDAVSRQRVLTRMKPSRRYAFDSLGSRYETSWRLLVAIDVSGSMSEREIARGLAIVNGLFRHHVSAIDVIQFDSMIRGRALHRSRGLTTIAIDGRGGTNFQCVIDYAQSHRSYGGVLIFTDGIAPPPHWNQHVPRAQRPALAWIINNRENYDRCAVPLGATGRTTFLRYVG